MERNKALIRKVRNIVKNHPDRHNQEVWYTSKFDARNLYRASVEKLRKYATKPLPAEQAMPDGYCGTTACVAGWAAILSAPRGTTLDGVEGLILPDGEGIDVQEYAAEQMGLDWDESDYLFHSARTREEILSNLDAMLAE